MSYNNLIEITKYLERFEADTKESFDIAKFALWLADDVAKKPQTGDFKEDHQEAIQQQSADVHISILIGRMYKYARVYTKKVLAKTPLNGLDDYSFMATLMFRESMTKSELIHYNLLDSTTSGADIIKRLIKTELVLEYENLEDKRSKRLKITDKGKHMMFEIFNEMNDVSNIITGNLGNDEKLYLLSYLKKLDHLHKNIYDNDRKEELSHIALKYIE